MQPVFLLSLVLSLTAALAAPSLSPSSSINTFVFVPAYRYRYRHNRVTISPHRQPWLTSQLLGNACDDEKSILFVEDRSVVIQEVSLDNRDELERMSKFCIDAFHRSDTSNEQEGSIMARRWKELKLVAMQKAQLLDISFSDASNRCIFVAKDTNDGNADDIVGCCEIVEDRIDTRQLSPNGITTSERERRKTARPRPVIENPCVKQGYRRCGVGAALVDACEDAVRQWPGEGEVFTQVDEDNIRAFELFRKCGYKQIFVDPTCTDVTLDGAFVKEITVTKRMMRKILSEKDVSVL